MKKNGKEIIFSMINYSLSIDPNSFMENIRTHDETWVYYLYLVTKT